MKDESWYDCDSVADATVFLFVNVLNRNGIPDNKNYVFSWACVLYCPHSLLEKKKTNKLVNSTGYKSSLTYSMILSPGGREGPGNIENLPTMPGTHVGERKEKL